MSKNTTQIKAAVVREKGGPFNVETLTLEGPRRDEVLVKVVATGLCHTDMVARDKGYPVPHPIVLGHEGAGIVESVGADVVKVAPGDSVVLTFLTCGRCKPCRLGRMAHCEKTFPLSLRRNAVGRQHCYSRRRWRESSRSLFRAIVVCDIRTRQ